MAIATNDSANVSVGKGLKGGYLFSAPVGTDLPAKYNTEAKDLAEGFVNLGYVSEDGINNTIEQDTENFSDMNGDTIESGSSSYTETIVFTLVEQKKDTLAEEYGHSNVSDEDGQLTAKHNSNPRERRSYVLLLVLKDGRRQTSVIPEGKVTEVGDKQYVSTDLVGRELTVTCYPDENGDCVIDYIESNETKAMD